MNFNRGHPLEDLSVEVIKILPSGQSPETIRLLSIREGTVLAEEAHPGTNQTFG